MKTGRIYRLTFQDFADSDIQEVVDISDMAFLIDDEAETIIQDVIPGPTPVRISAVDNDEDPFTPVRGQQLTIEIDTNDPVSMDTFAGGADDRWYVHNYIGDKTIFKGFLVLDDISEPFMPEPNVLTLTASDGLGLLRDQPLVDFEDENPVGEYRIAELLAMALRKTGLELGIKAAYNIKNDGFVDDISIPNENNQHFFVRNYLNAKTFEDQIGTCVSCREVLEDILGEGACLFQRQGYWWIKRIDEIETDGLYITEFDSEGEFVGNLGRIDFDKTIEKDSDIFFSLEETRVVSSRPLKSVELTYNYDTPIEIVENIDFERGDLILDSGATKTYELDDWLKLFSNTSSDDLATADIYIRRTFVNDYDVDKFVVIEASSDFHFIMSQPIPVGLRDKFFFGIQRRLSVDIGGSGFVRENHIQVRLYGNDGTFWTLKTPTSASRERKWVECNSSFRTNQQYLAIEYDLSNDLTEAVDVYNGESAEMPVAGYLRILLYASSEHGDTVATYFSGLTFDYRPLINGSHARYTAQSQKKSQIDNLKARREMTVKVSDSPRMLFKGALLTPLLFVEVFSGEVIFTTSNSFKIAGYHLAKFRKGQRLNISGTTSNNIVETRVTEVEYSIVGTETIVHIEATTTTETDASTLVQELTYELANEFYDAARDPDGSEEDVKPFSEIQIFDVWNQFAEERRIFQATIQGLDIDVVDGDSERDNCHLIHKYTLADAHLSTNGRFFDLLTFEQDHRTGEWTALLREVYNVNRTKATIGNEFKYKI